MPTRIKNFANTAATIASDDYFAIDGATNGTRKMLVTVLATQAGSQLGTAGMLFGAGSAAAPKLAIGTAGNGIYASAANTLDFTTNGAQSWQITSTGVLQRVGAGTFGTSTGNLTIQTGGGNGNLLLNTNGTGLVGINVTTPVSALHVGTSLTSSPRGVMSAQYSTSTDGARFHMRKARGTEGAPVIIVTGDVLGKLVASGYDGAAYQEMGTISIQATGTIAAGRIPTQIVLATATDSAPSVLTDRWTIGASGSLVAAGAQTFGTATGNLTVSTGGGNGNILLNNNGTGLVGVNTATPVTALHVSTSLTTSPRGIMSAQYTTDALGARIHMRKARGTEGTPTIVVTGDDLGRIQWAGYDGAAYQEMASIRSAVTGTVAAGRVPTQLIFSTATDAAPSVLTDRMWLSPLGNLLIGTSTDPFGTGGNLAFTSTGPFIFASGTTTAARYVSVQNTTGRVFFGVDSSAGTTMLNTGGLAYSGVLTTVGSTALQLGVNQTAVMTIATTGAVGIGTTVPGAFGLAVNHATGQSLDLIYNDSDGSPANHAKITVGAGGILTIEPLTSTTTPTSVAVVGKFATTATSVTIATAATTFAVASNVVTVTGDGGGNTVATITGGVSGQILTLIFVDGLVTVTDDASGAANTVNLSAAFTSTANDTLTLVFNGTSWREVARSVN